ncbi:M10 family metallopeptidase [Argonema galeatum]|uniref:M10 family metallopeptidase n=1 Tax=Argonema galeatum TaxID=2942762 RepID=UPI002012E786|nr:M10 family metallopeptidase [Argonema galeatum]MCL1468210.1 M10 family metallopeptidase C-terminal domain-containing protein [Argonema galeatum A003/A1]
MFPPVVLPLNIAEIYDESFYRASNSELALFSSRDLNRHFLTNGVREGRKSSPFFDLSFYRDSNPNLRDLDNQQLVNHFLAVGVTENRKFSPYIDLDFYQQNNPDLAGLDRAQLFEHLKSSGLAEGRRFSPSIDLNSYRTSHPNLAGLGNEQLFEQLQISGAFVPPPTNVPPPITEFFDAEFYRKANPDLATAGIVTDAQLLEHFQNFGLDDAGRKFSPVLDLDYYLANNSDLVAAGIDTRREAYSHFQQNGLDEGRRFSQFFDVNYYLDNNRRDNLTLREAGLTPRQGFADFQNTGLEQGLRPSLIFNPVYYRDNNSDLAVAKLTNREAFEHFQVTGLREGRRSSIFFDPQAIAALIRTNFQAGSVDPTTFFRPTVKWNIPANGTLTYSFVSTASAFLYEGPETGIRELDDQTKNNIRNILRQYSQFIPVNFMEVADRPPNIGQLRFMYSNREQAPNSLAYAYYPKDPGDSTIAYPVDSLGGDVHLNPNKSAIDFAFGPGSSSYELLLQKVGQALGLKPVTESTPNLNVGKDNNTNTVMTSNFSTELYNGEPRYNGVMASTPMPYDIRALQFLYGASYVNNTDTTYRFDAGNFFGIKQTIWDSGGIDTLDFSGLPPDVTGYYFDMNEGGQNTQQVALNSATYLIPRNDSNQPTTDPATLPEPDRYNTSIYSTSIAFGSEIENLIGSGGNDQILGNVLANNILGNAGNDKITGARGKDTLTGGGGADIFGFAAGDGGLNLQDADVIIDFQDGVDRIGLALGLPVGALSIIQGSGANANDTLLQIASTGEYLAVLSGVPVGAIDGNDFVSV